MKGYWFFLAIVALCGCSIPIGIHWGLVIFFHLIWLRMFLLKKRFLLYSAILVYAIFALIGLWANEQRISFLNPHQTNFLITFLEYPQIDGNQLKSIGKTDLSEKVVLKYKIQTEEEKKKLLKYVRSGQTCKVNGDLIKPEANRNENLFNYKLYLYRQNIHWILDVSEIVGCKEGEKELFSWIHDVREQGLKKVESLFSEAAIPYAKALIFGDNSSFSEEIYSLYQRLGIVHLLAISGLHVGVISAGIFYILIRIGLIREFTSYALLTILPLYAIITGANPPVVRAVTMSMLLIVSIQKKSPFSSLDALSISFLFFLFKDPYILFHIGFQLSFIVCLSILLASKSILPRYNNFFVKSMMISVISQVAAIPILSFHFFEVSIISILSNVLYVPFYTFITLPVIFITYLSSYLHHSIFSILEKVTDMIVNISEKLGYLLDVKGAVLVIGKPNIVILILLILVSQFVLFQLEKGLPLIKAVFPLILIICFIKIFQMYHPIGEVTFIDVGQGDSIFIRLPYHRGNYLIDTGGQLNFPQDEWMKRKKTFSVGNDIIIPFLKSQGITRIDKLILTHSDVDHMGEAIEIMERTTVNQLLVSPNSWVKPVMLNTVEMAKELRIPIKIVKDGVKWENRSGVFQFVYPFINEYEGNNSSLVLYAQFGGKRWLFTGDLEKQGEEEMIRKYRMDIDVIKIGHHGSKGSSSPLFIEHFKPKYAIISAGKNNRYGHPHQDVLGVLEKNNTKILRTDENGAIQYKYFQNDGTFHTILP
ncbi:DNA internalization-related competence protein ComEC/Rec2 [Heyndrickxia sp. NPDC080065]|uniref:DNA internalization-related competence protein ComEC/Rec2 n=1 Tax=Heyndrickxia sp. NPDC080065 TaxID=3390568 RepID=UPI003D055442